MKCIKMSQMEYSHMGVTVDSPIDATTRPSSSLFHGRAPEYVTLTGARGQSPTAGSTAIWVGIATIGMMFAALTSALVVRQGASTDWRRFDWPVLIYVNTVILLASSVTLQRFVKNFKSTIASKPQEYVSSGWLYTTLALGGIFVVGQCLVWRMLVNRGLYMASNPSHSFFYVLTGAHVLHLCGGLIALAYVAAKHRRDVLPLSTLNIAATYWHFMDLLWLYVLGLLWLKV